MECRARTSHLRERFRRARRDSSLAVLEGFHPLKHALRFGAELLEIVTEDPDRLARLARRLSPDGAEFLAERVHPVTPEEFSGLSPVPPPTGVIAIARRPPAASPEAILAAPGPAPAVLLEEPARLGNLGAAIRAAAAAGATGVIAAGRHDPWHPEAIRGAAGLQFALPIGHVQALAGWPNGAAGRPRVAVDPGGEPIVRGLIPPRAILAFGSERAGLSDELARTADLRIAIPMRPGVSSLNLASAVAVVLYAWRLG